VYGEPAVSYVSDQTPMLTYLNTHMAIDQLRNKLSSADRIGPKVRQKGWVAKVRESKGLGYYQSCALSVQH